jgi:hypothetical protein
MSTIGVGRGSAVTLEARWRTKVHPRRPVEHASCDDAEAYFAQLGARYRACAASLRLVRLYDPDGGVQLYGGAAHGLLRCTGADWQEAGRRMQYDVALSFAGEDRQYVYEVAELLRSRGVRVSYDEYERANLWGRNLIDHLTRVHPDEPLVTDDDCQTIRRGRRMQ